MPSRHRPSSGRVPEGCRLAGRREGVTRELACPANRPHSEWYWSRLPAPSERYRTGGLVARRTTLEARSRCRCSQTLEADHLRPAQRRRFLDPSDRVILGNEWHLFRVAPPDFPVREFVLTRDHGETSGHHRTAREQC